MCMNVKSVVGGGGGCARNSPGQTLGGDLVGCVNRENFPKALFL